MNGEIQILTVPFDIKQQITDDTLLQRLEFIGLTPDEIFEQGDQIRIAKFQESDFGDLSLPSALEAKKTEADPLVGIFAITTETIHERTVSTVLGQLYIYSARSGIPFIEGAFEKTLSYYRRLYFDEVILYFGALGLDTEKFKSVALSKTAREVEKIFKAGFDYAIKESCVMAFACTHPTAIKYYVNQLGFAELGKVDKIPELANNPGILLHVTPTSVKLERLSLVQ
jgi:hypothetical protein